MLRWDHLREWGDFIEACSYLHEHDGYPKASPVPTPQGVLCDCPTVVCVESGWAIEMCGRWVCTAPESHDAYFGGARCPARGGKAHALSPQTTPDEDSVPFEDDKETIEVLEWLKRALASVSASERECAWVARIYLHDGDDPLTWDDLEALGSELMRRCEASSRARES